MVFLFSIFGPLKRTRFQYFTEFGKANRFHSKLTACIMVTKNFMLQTIALQLYTEHNVACRLMVIIQIRNHYNDWLITYYLLLINIVFCLVKRSFNSIAGVKKPIINLMLIIKWIIMGNKWSNYVDLCATYLKSVQPPTTSSAKFAQLSWFSYYLLIAHSLSQPYCIWLGSIEVGNS